MKYYIKSGKAHPMFKYKVDIIDNMRQFLVTSLKYLKCAIVKHTVSDDAVRSLFSPARGGFIRTTCTLCHSPLLLRRDPADPDGDYYMLMET